MNLNHPNLVRLWSSNFSKISSAICGKLKIILFHWNMSIMFKQVEKPRLFTAEKSNSYASFKSKVQGWRVWTFLYAILFRLTNTLKLSRGMRASRKVHEMTKSHFHWRNRVCARLYFSAASTYLQLASYYAYAHEKYSVPQNIKSLLFKKWRNHAYLNWFFAKAICN